MKNLIAVLASLALLTNQASSSPPPDPQPVAPIAVGVVVICVGGYCVYKLVKVCQKVFPPKSTNSNDGFYASGEEYGGAYEYSSIGSCAEPNNPSLVADQTSQPTTFTLNVLVEPAGVTTSMSATAKEGTAQTWSEFQADMATHGFLITGHPSPEPQFSRNGVPCDESAVPLWFNPVTGAVTQRTAGDLRHVVIERSRDLATWSRLLETDVGAGTGFKVVDTTANSSMFYRVSMPQL